ncbi:hypothetical protein V2J09_003425 [Rumex salicifolius]
MADEESLKMATLKKAYAEIILNTSKEAAARIMVADRRALSFEKELFALKQDALRMLVQLKHTLDSKNAEAEIRSANQQRKIEELEAQLSEAEGIIVDLREDLRLTQDKLEKQKQPFKQHSFETHKDHRLTLETQLKAQTYDGSYQTIEYVSSEIVGSAQVQPSTPFQLSTQSHCDPSLETYHRVKSGRERCSSCSSESDEKDTQSTCCGSEAKSLEYEGHYFKDARDGFRRTRKNVKYREAIAALRSCSRGRRSRSCQPPSFPRCSRTDSGKQVEVPDKSGVCPMPGSCYATSNHEMNDDNDTAQERSSQIIVKESDISSDIDPLKLKPSSVDSTLNVQIYEGKSNLADSDKVLKFTFQRKRKKKVLSKLDNNITSEGEHGHPAKLQKTIMNDEHARDSQQLLQVAHQLIALSGNGPS